jgi:hypothetical protein
VRIEECEFGGHADSFACRVGNRRLVITGGVGPRILSLSIGDGPNILFVDERGVHARGDWRLYGGHRLWVAPETEATYAPDNDRCRVETDQDRITVTAPEKAPGIERAITVSERGGNFVVTHTVTNRAETLAAGALWALTCVMPEGTIFFPWGTGGDWDLRGVVYWKGWMGSSTDFRSPQFVPTDDLFLVRPTGEVGKVGTAGHGGFVGVTTDHYTFVKRFDRHPAAPYPDEGCAIQCYTCPDFVELETLGPVVTLFPNVPVTHVEEWVVSEGPIDPEDGAAVRRLVEGR